MSDVEEGDYDEEFDVDEFDELDDVEGEEEAESEEGEDDSIIDEVEEEASAPECKTIKVVARDKRKTSDTISLFELTAIVGIRAQDISKGGDIIFCEIGEGHDMSAIDIAIKEIVEKKCPLSIERKVKNDTDGIVVEIWDVNELMIPQSLLQR